MPPRYCIDTSGFSNPYDAMPEDIHDSLWKGVRKFISSGDMAITQEIFDEMIKIDGGLGAFIASEKAVVLYEIGQDHWDWQSYVANITRMQVTYGVFIQELNGNVKNTIGLNDLSIIALARTLNLPLLSMEKRKGDASPNQRHIPDICGYEKIDHIDFSDFCRREKMKF
jgi:Domain of unknown function (DUF4411)